MLSRQASEENFLKQDDLSALSEEQLYDAFFVEDKNKTITLDPGSLELPTLEPFQLNENDLLDFPDALLQEIKSEEFLDLEFVDQATPTTTSSPSSQQQQVIVVDDASDDEKSVLKRKKEENSPTLSRTIKKPKQDESNKTKVSVKPEKNLKRLESNKKSAQACRERKRQLKVELETQLNRLLEDNKGLQTNLNELETENRVLKGEFAHLQSMIINSSMLTKIMYALDSATKLQQQDQTGQYDPRLLAWYQQRAQQMAYAMMAMMIRPPIPTADQSMLNNSLPSFNTTPVA